MQFTVRANTFLVATLTLGVVQLIGVGHLWMNGFNASTTVGYGWTVATIAFTIMAIVGRRLPAWVCGIASTLALYSVFQAAAFWFTTPTPPATWEYYFGALQGVVMLGLALFLKRWMDAGERAARLDAEAQGESYQTDTST